MSSKTIDERVVEMRFDNQQFEKNVQTSLSTLDKLKRALRLDGVAKEFEKLEKTSANFGMSGLSKAVDTVQAKFSALEVIGVTALANITNSAVNAGKRIVKALTIDPVKTGFQEYETQINAVQTILANTSAKGTTLEQVNEALDELNHYADKTIYNFTEMTRNIGTFTAAGVDLDTSVSAIKGIANLAAVSGSTSQQASTAMYQLSQALAAGTVKLMDWNSVVNAGMGGEVFQNALKETARVHGIAIDQMIKDEGSFRETLSRGWLSSEILTETLEKFTGDLSRAQLLEKGYTEQQIDSIMEMGQTANDAATKVKTFTQLVDTLKEAAQSGWTETWETIVGDFEEAKALWTAISDELGSMIGASADARNELLSGALDSGWSNFLKEGITDAVGFKESIVNAAMAHGVATETLVRTTDKFEHSLDQGWITADILSDALADLTEKTAGLSDAELVSMGMTREQVNDLEKLNQAVRDGTVDLDEYAGKIARMSGRDNLIQSFWNIWNAFFANTEEQIGLITALKDAFRDIFPRTTSEQLYAFTEGLRKFTEKFKMSSETADKVKRSFKGLFAVLDIVSSFVKAGLKTGLDILSSALGGVDLNLLDMTAAAGDAIVSFRNWLKENNIFAGSLGAIANGLKFVVGLIRDWTASALSMPQVQERMAKAQKTFAGMMNGIRSYFAGGLEQIHAFIERVKALDSIRLDNLGDILRDFRDNVVGYFVTLGGRFTSFGDLLNAFKSKAVECLTGVRDSFADLDEFAEAAKDHIKGYFSGLTNHLDGVLKQIIKFIAAIRAKIGDTIGLGEVLTIGIGIGLMVTVKKIGDALELLAAPFEAFSGIAKGFSSVLSSTSKAINAFALQTKSKALINVAGAIAILVGSIAVLTMLDQSKLLAAIGTLGVLAAGLVGLSAAMAALEKLGSVKKISISFTAIAASLLILIAALKKLEGVDGDQLWGNLGVLALLTAGLTAAAIAVSKAAPQLTKGSVFLVAFSTSLRILVGVMENMEGLDPSKSGRAIPVMIATIGGLALVARACGNLKIGSALGVLAVAAGLSILAGTFQKIARLDLTGAKSSIDAFVAIFASFAGIMAASKLAGANAAKAGVGILAMSAALLLLVPAIKGLGKIDPLDMERASDSITKLLLVFAAVTAASKLAGANAAKAGAMLLMMSGALVILSGVMVLLTHLDPEGLDRALAAITKLELVFGVVIAMTHFAGEAKGTLTLLAVSTGLLATALGALSLIDPARLKSATTCLSLVMGAFSLVIASTHLAKKANAAIVAMTIAVGGLAAILVALSNANAQNTITNATALSEVMVALAAAMAIAGKARGISASALAALGVMTLVVTGLAALLGTMSYLDITASLETSAALSLLLVALSGSCLLLKKAGAGGPAAFTGVAALTTLIVAIGGIMAGLGALNAYFPEMEEFLGTGLGLLEKIGQGLGSFVGNIVGSFLAGTTSGLPEIGENLSAFIESAKPFFNDVKDIDAEAMRGVEAMASAILSLSGADILNGLTSWFTGGTSLATFGEQLKEFGAYFKEYADEVGEIDNLDVVTASSSAAKTLAEFATAIPNSGGVLGRLAGENSLSVFGKELEVFGPSFARYAESVSNVGTEAVTASASAAKSLAEFVSVVPNSGGYLAALMGDNRISDFARELTIFGPAFAAYAESVRNIPVETVVTSSTAAKSLAEFASTVPNSGGWLSKITGENSISAFASELKVFGPAFAEYAQSVSNVTPDAVIASASAAQSLAALAKDLPNSGGLMGYFTGNNDIGQFGEQLAAFGASFKMYYDSISEISDAEKVTAATNGLQSLLAIAKGAGNGNSLKNFGNFLKGLAETRLDDFINTFTNAEGRIRKAGESLGRNLETGAGKMTANFKKVGQDAAQGFINGINSRMGAVSSAGRSMGNAAVQSARRALDSHSPSKEFEKVGKDADDGLALGLTKNGRTIRSAISGVVNDAKTSISELASVDIDKWIGKTAKSGETETKVYQETAKEAKKSAKTKTQAAKKAASAYESFVEYIEEERFYNRISTAEQLEQYKKVLATYKLTAEERKKVSREIYTLEQQLRSETYQASLDWIEEEKYYNRLSLEEELAAYEKIQARYLEGTEERKKADREVYRLRNELASASYQASLDWIEEEKYYGRLSLIDELVAYARIQNRYAKGTEERKKMDREVYRLQKELADAQKQYFADAQQVQEDAAQRRLELEQEYADKVRSINDQLAQDIQAANDKYENAVRSRTDALYRSYGLFDKAAERKDVKGSVLMENLQGQVKEFSDWQDALDHLSARGLSEDLMGELQEMGPSAISEIKALESMSDSELEKYAGLWAIKHAQAREQAVTELEGLRSETRETIANLRIASSRELDDYRTMWSQQMSELTDSTNQQLAQLKQNFGEAVGIIKKNTAAEMKAMTETANGLLRQAGWDETGQQIVNGLTGGVEKQKSNFFSTLTNMALAGVKAVTKVLGIHSPSRVFGEVGNYAGLGFVNALESYVDRAYDAGSEMAGAAKEGLGNSIQKIADVVNNDIDVQPSIRPVLDLTDIARGAGEMNGLLGSSRSVGLAWSAAAGMKGPAFGGGTNITVQSDDVVEELRALRGEMASMSERLERMQIVLDTGTLVGELAEPMDSALGRKMTYKGRGI